MQISKRNIQIKLLLLFLIVFTESLLARQQYYFKQISLQNGLSQSTVNCILVDDRGVMWIGTRFGLNRFDREKIQVYKEDKNDPHSLPSNNILFLKEDAQDNIWIGTQNGLARLNRTNGQFIREEMDGKPIAVSCGLKAAEGIYFFGANDVFLYSYQKEKFVRCPATDRKLRSYPYYAGFIDDGEKKVLLSFWGEGLYWYYLTDGRLEPAGFNREQKISACFINSRKQIWISPYNQGLYCYDSDGKLLRHLTAPDELSHNTIEDIQEKDGEMWIATDGGGINIYNYRNNSIKKIQHVPGNFHSLPVNSFACLYNDDENNIWAGSIRGGLIGIKQVTMTTYQDAQLGATYGLTNQIVTGIYEDKGHIIWMGTDGGGLNRFDPQTETFHQYTRTYGMKIVSIIPYNSSELLLSLFSTGLFRFNKATGQSEELKIDDPLFRELFSSGNAVRLHRLDEDRFCLMSDFKLYIYNQKEKRLKPIVTGAAPRKLSHPQFYAGDSCYISYAGGLCVLDPQSDTIRSVYSADEKIGYITSVCQDSQKRFWIGASSGLYRFDREQNRLDTINTERLISITAVCFDRSDRLWVSTHDGLYAYVPSDNKIVIFGESDGVFTQEFLIKPPLKTQSGDIYMAGTNGIVRIRNNQSFPEEEEDSSISLINLTQDGIQVYADGFPGDPVISIPWDYNSLSLNVIVKENDLMRKKLFRFHLKGDREETVETSSHTFSFPPLSPGSYELWASYSKKNGDWSTPLQLLTIHVVPPFWQKGWFLGSALLFILISATWIIKSILDRKEKEMVLAMKEHERKVYEGKVRFLINISHELRTPLTLIYAPLQRLLTSGKIHDEGIFHLLGNLLLQTRRIRDIVDMVLDAQKSEEKEEVPDIRPHNLNEWIQTVTDDFKLELQARHMQLEFHLDPSIGQIPFDASKCRTVLSNFLMNALKFSETDTRLLLSTQSRGAFVRISLSDQGIGLAHVDMEQLFMPYYQGNHSVKGNGIGLAYSRKLIELHNGHIGAFNNEDRGATFYFDLPVKQEKTMNQPRQEKMTELSNEKEEIPASPDFLLTPYTLLIVEDEPDLRNYLVTTFRSEFKQVYGAEDGQEALEMIGKCQPDLIVSDIMMPRMDGFELCRRVKSDIAISHIPVVLLTARADKDSTLQGYKLGADMYLAKPFDIDYLLVVLRNLLKQRETLRSRYWETNRIFTPKEDAISNADEQFMQKLNALIQDNLSNPDLNITFIASEMAMSRTTLYSKFGNLSDISIGDYITKIRMMEACRLLTSNRNSSIQDVADRTGFSSSRYFSTVFKQTYGITPTEYRKRGTTA